MLEYNNSSQPKEVDVFNKYKGRNKLRVTLITVGLSLFAFLIIFFFAKSMLTYTISYVTFGGTSYGKEVSTQEYRFLDKTYLPEGLKKEGYYIDGFYKDEDFTKSFKFGRPMWRSTTIYIDWKPGYAVQLFFVNGEDSVDRVEGNKTGIDENYLKLYHEQYVKPGSTYTLPKVFNDVEDNKHYGEQLLWYDNIEGVGEPFEKKTYTLNDNTKIYGRWFDTDKSKFDITPDGTLKRYLGNCFNIKLPSNVKRFKSIDDPSKFKGELWDTSRVFDGTNYSVFDRVIKDVDTIYINAECEEINSCVFKGCSKLKNVVFAGNKITEIGLHAFAQCESLESINLPKSVTKIGIRSFYMSGIKNITGIENVTYIGDVAFANSKIVNINLPKTTFIGGSAFAGCYKLKSITLGANQVVQTNVSVDMENIFYSVTSMKIYVPAGLVDSYKTTYPWSAYFDEIFAIEA